MSHCWPWKGSFLVLYQPHDPLTHSLALTDQDRIPLHGVETHNRSLLQHQSPLKSQNLSTCSLSYEWSSTSSKASSTDSATYTSYFSFLKLLLSFRSASSCVRLLLPLLLLLLLLLFLLLILPVTSAFPSISPIVMSFRTQFLSRTWPTQ